MSLHTARELPSGADVVLSPELWDLVLGQLQPEGAEAGSSSNNHSGKVATVNGVNKKLPPPSRVAISINRRYKLEHARLASSQSPISALVCWACLDNLPLTATEQQKQHDKGKGKSKEQTVSFIPHI